MKKLLILAAFIAMPLIANDTTTAPATTETTTTATDTAATTTTTAAATKKLTYKAAKAECTKEGKKDADLKTCIKEKTGKN